jgi:hypothetical protein
VQPLYLRLRITRARIIRDLDLKAALPLAAALFSR